MPSVDVVVETPISQSARCRQLEGMFDVPAADKSRIEWHASLPIEERDWNVGLIVGPSGSGKTTIARKMWPEQMARRFEWGAPSVIDDFDSTLSMQSIAEVCGAVGFNTIPAWRRPFAVLSNGEQFRASIARSLLTPDPVIVVDEFTSVVDRQVAKITAHAVQKYVRRSQQRFVGVTCHYDVIDWLQPDWTYDVATDEFAWRSLQRRPAIDVIVGPVARAAWRVFAPFHYLTADVHVAAFTYGLWADGRLASIACMLHRPSKERFRDAIGCARLVTLPDWQGLGLAMKLVDVMGAIYRAAGVELRCYPAHPSLIRSFDRSPQWALRKRPGQFSAPGANTKSTFKGGRPCAVFAYTGAASNPADAARVLSFWHATRSDLSRRMARRLGIASFSTSRPDVETQGPVPFRTGKPR